MVKKQQIESNQTTTSALERFSLDFEYNKTLRDIKSEIRGRTI